MEQWGEKKKKDVSGLKPEMFRNPSFIEIFLRKHSSGKKKGNEKCSYHK
jgi:hypothetical protein